MPSINQILRAGGRAVGPAKRTATIERYGMWGTGRPTVRVTYRGTVISWRESNGWAIAQATDTGDDVIEAMRGHAKKQGFTHVRYAGDWSGRTTPKGGKL